MTTRGRDMTVEEHFRDKIEHEIQFYETCAGRIDARYREQVERLAKKTPDKWLADFYRELMTPHHIGSRLADIRALLNSGEIVEADRSFDHLKAHIHAVEERLRRPYFEAGAKVRSGGIAAAKRRWGEPEARSKRADEMRKLWEAKRSQGKGRADSAVAKAFRVSTKTVREVRKTWK